MSKFEPRPATTADVEAITALVRAAYAVYIPRMGREPYPMTVNYAEAIRNQQVWVAEEGGQIIAVLGLTAGDDHMMVENVAVNLAQQGSGVGRKLLTFAEAEAHRQGLHEMRLYTAEAMTENIQLYSRFGYVETERKVVMEIPRVYMSKRLSS